MANRYRGEIEADLFGRKVKLCLTLGALAELEEATGGDLAALAARLGAGKPAMRDLVALIAAGLRGGGEAEAAREVAALPLAGGLGTYAQIVRRLLEATFEPAEDPAPGPSQGQTAPGAAPAGPGPT